MSVLLTTSRHSFFNLMPFNVEEAGCLDDVDLCLPVYQLSDLAFQVVAYVDGSDKDWFEQEYMGSPNTIRAGICDTCPSDEEAPQTPPAALQFNSKWNLISSGTTDVWLGEFNVLDPPAWEKQVGECFKICLYRLYSGMTGDVTIKLACTNYCFQRIADHCDTSLFTYRCNEDSFDFLYKNFPTFKNKVRLPAYLLNMQLPSEEKTYRTSNGQFIKLFERIDEEYELKIDYVPKHWHCKIKVLLAHDDVTIKNPNEFGNLTIPIVCREKYDIMWQEVEYINAPAKTKVLRSEALHTTNSYCN